jgi:hypothetical protein
VVEGARLESVYRGDSIVGSNPTVSARLSITSMACGEFVVLAMFLQELVADFLAQNKRPHAFKNLPDETPPGWHPRYH